MINIAIFASGGGSNAHAIVQYFENHPSIQVSLIISNKKNAGVLALCDRYGISKLVIDKNTLANEKAMTLVLQNENIKFIVLAGFLMMIPPFMIQAFPDKIINIHPSLLPKYGGKGMYGHYVHEAVYEAGDLQSGMTIHLVNEEYDKGRILFQATCPILSDMTAEDIGAAVLILEHKYFSPTIEKYILTD